MDRNKKLILRFGEISIKDVPLVGGKNASIGEMFSQLGKHGIRVPDGFALTSVAYWYYLKVNKIDKKLKEIFKNLNSRNIKNLQEVGRNARKLILNANIPTIWKKKLLKITGN